jgi:hypothetical protein
MKTTKPAVQTAVVTLTPKLAAEWLATRGQQRDVIPNVVKKYTSQMKQALWVFNAEPVMFDEHGALIDGQHRCLAVISSGVTIEVLVVRGLSTNAFQSLNQGRVRDGGCVLSIMGVSNSRLIATMLNVIYRIQNGTESTRGAVPNTMIEKLWGEYPEIQNAASLIVGNKFLRRHFPCGWLGALWVLGSRKHGEDITNRFFHQLITGVNLTPTSPVLLLRERAISWYSSKGIVSEQEKAALIIKAWNAYISNRSVKLLKYTRGGESPEQFPTIQ